MSQSVIFYLSMKPPIALLILAAVTLLIVFRRQILWFFVRKAVNLGLSDIGARALAKQPDEIHLLPQPAHRWTNEVAIRALADPLLWAGFSEAGTYTVDKLPGMAVRFLLKADKHVYAAIYEHPKAGIWLNLVSLYQDGTSITFSTQRDRGLGHRPGHAIVYAPGAAADAVSAASEE